jgi:hypothetical protein
MNQSADEARQSGPAAALSEYPEGDLSQTGRQRGSEFQLNRLASAEPIVA